MWFVLFRKLCDPKGLLDQEFNSVEAGAWLSDELVEEKNEAGFVDDEENLSIDVGDV